MMFRAIACGVVSAVLLASAALAQTSVIAKAGEWKAFGGTTTGEPPTGVCGVSHDLNARYFGLKLFAGEDTFTIQMGTKRWTVAEKQRIGVTMRIDDYPVWTATGTTFRFADGDMGIEYDINKNQVGKFMAEFRAGSQIRIQFQNPGMPEWVLGLKGTSALSDAFMGCTRKLK
ncbi:MAG: hypothetical protein Q8M19_13985 [Reyranella sp.]|nr:hypothetical protein [Reyranella sp.]